jgi:hypothetical protein
MQFGTHTGKDKDTVYLATDIKKPTTVCKIQSHLLKNESQPMKQYTEFA